MQPSRPVLAVLFVLLLGVATSVTPAGPGQGKVSEPGDGRWVAYTVAEDPLVAEDLNGDGDSDDRVLQVLDTWRGTVVNLGLVPGTGREGADIFFLEGDLLVFPVRESLQGMDLNFDGDLSDDVLHVFDAATGSTTNVALAVAVLLLEVERNWVAFGVPESSQAGTDLNGDGDASDTVLHLFDAGSGRITNPGFAIGSKLRIEGDLLTFMVIEADQADIDLNRDGDTRDSVLHTFDLSSGVTTNTGLATHDKALDHPAVIKAVADGTITAQTLALAASQAITPADFKVAFIGDQNNGSNARAVLQLILDEGADMVLHQGDLAYDSNIIGWDQMITDVLGADFPYFASVGNHDDQDWPEYQQVLSARLALVPGASCSGPPADLGIQSSCTYQGLFFILSGVGTLSGPGPHAEYIRDELALDNSTWSICSWHKNQREMQIGGKGSSTGWEVYEECRMGGAIIATAHEHSYSRTKTLTSTELQIVDPDWPQVGEVRVAEGATFVFVSGLGGGSIRDQERCLPDTPPYGCSGEWASIYSSNQGADFGALFCSFHVDGQPNKAHCYFKDISGNVIDDFNVTSFLGAALGSPPLTIDDSATTVEDMTVVTDVMANDLDPDGDILLLLSFDSASTNGGTVTRLDGGTPGDASDDDLLYTPAPDFNGVDSYGYAVSDGVFTSTATVTVTVDPINDPPLAVNDPDFTPINTPVITDVLANDSDPDGDTLLLLSFDATSTQGAVTRDDRGTFSDLSDDRLIYSPPQDFEGVDTYSYTVSDGALSASATVTVTVADNLPPLAVDDPETTAINTVVTTDVLANDSDPEGDPLFLDSFDTFSTQGGSVSRDDRGTPGFTGDDQLVYTPPASFVGVDTYGYTVADDKGGLATATVTVTVVAADIIFELRVNSGSDDAEEQSSGSVGLTSSDLEMVQESSAQQVGIRFQGVDIPPGATIVNAWVQFQADETDNIATSLTIEAEASVNPVTFSSTNGNISSRPRLPVSVAWSPPAWNTVNEQGPDQRTPNLAPVIQEVVKQQNWTSGNSLVLIISGSGKRVADSYNGNANGAALLHVEYASGPPANTPPMVDAGADDTIAWGYEATLDATVTDDGLLNPVTTIWTGSGPGTVTFGNSNAVDTTASFSGTGTYMLRLTADDGEWQPFDELTITVVNNQAPTVSVAPVPSITLPAGAVLDGTVTDDGLPASPGVVTTLWEQTGGPGTVTFGGTNAVDTTASFSLAGTYVLRLTADDSASQSFADVTVIVDPAPPNLPPTVSVAPVPQLTLPADAVLDGTVTDDGLPASPGVVTTLWEQTGGPGTVTFGDLTAVDTTASFSLAGIYVLRLTADDGEFSVFAELAVEVLPPPPGPQTIIFELRLNSSSDDAEEQSSGSVGLTSSDLELIQESSAQQVGIRFQGVDIPPGATIVDAWVQFQADETDNVATSLIIEAEASVNPVTFSSSNGNISSRPRLRVSVPWSPAAWNTVNEQGPGQRTPNLALVIQEVVKQQNWVSGNSLVLIITGNGKRVADSYNGNQNGAALLHVEYATGGPPVNSPPLVDAGADDTIAWAYGATLDGTVTDDGLLAPVSTAWSMTSGPGTVTFGDPNATDTTASFSTDGSYVLRLTADDGEWQPFDEVTITVVNNQAPTVLVASDSPVTLPTDAVLDGTVTDDGLPAPVTTTWSMFSGPGTVTFGDPSAVDTTASFSLAGSYVLRLTADDGEISTVAELSVTVNAAPPNLAPVVDAGADDTVAWGNGATLDATVDDDGLPAAANTTWSMTSGPGTVTFGNSNAVDTTASFSTYGDYVLRLTADDGEFSHFDELTVQVLEPLAGPQTIFFDDYQQNEPFTLWVESNEFDWTVKAPEEKQVPGSASGNRVGHADNCDNGCFLTLAQTIDLSLYESATLSFWRYVDRSLDSGEYLRVEISDGFAWTTIFEWTHGSGDDDQWHPESYNISATHLVTGFSMRFVSRSTRSGEDNEIDDVLLEGMPLVGGNRRPVADAGSDQTVTDPDGDGLETVTLDGSASADPDGQIVDWEWAEGGSVLGNAETLDIVLLVGDHTVSLTVTDDGGATATDELLVRVFPLGGGDPTILEVRVNSGSDDAEERASSGSVGLTSSDLELVFDGSRQQTVGMRFVGVTIPPGAMIVNAWVQFQADETDNVATSLTIEAEANVDPVTFSSTNGNVSSRPRLPVSVPWSLAAWNTVNEQGPGQRTPNLALVIQEVVKQQNWTSGNSVVLIITGSGKRVADSYNGNSNGAALLHVEYL